MNDVVSRHKLPPRAHPSQLSPRSPDSSNNPAISGLDVYVPPLDASSQPMLSRESWLVYMDALEENVETARKVDTIEILHEEEEPRASTDALAHTPEIQDHPRGDDKLLKRNSREARDLESQLIKAFRKRQSSTSMSDSSEDEHADMTFKAGATLTRLLSSRSVAAKPRIRNIDQHEASRDTAIQVNPADPNLTLTRSSSSRQPIPIFDSSQIPLPGTASSHSSSMRPGSVHSELLSASGHENSWRKSIVSSEGAPHSQESSPKASPRAFVNLDDLEGYSDLFYRGGPGSVSSRPRSGGSARTINSSGNQERSRRPDFSFFGSRGGSNLAAVNRSFSPERPSSGSNYSSGGLNPSSGSFRYSGRFNQDNSRDGSWASASLQHNPASQHSPADLSRTWDPEEDGTQIAFVSWVYH